MKMAVLRASAVAVALMSAACTVAPPLKKPLPPLSAARERVFERETTAALGITALDGNRIDTLENGAEIFPALLSAIRSARRSVNFETFVYWQGRVPQTFADELSAAARRGVEVNVVLDAVGAGKARAYRAGWEAAGVHVSVFHPLFWFDPRRANYRTHRKLLVVDGHTAFIGGVGIADEWAGDARSPEEWRDLHYRVRGPVVAQLQGAFLENWQKLNGTLVRGEAHFPQLRAEGKLRAAGFTSAPRQGRCEVEVLYHQAIAGARRSIRVISPYFLPDGDMMDALIAARARGVRVDVIMPVEHIDAASVRRASRKKWGRLLQGGVVLWEYEPTMIHTKLLVVDDCFTSVGSANFDPRSLRINDEANIVVFDRGFARQQAAIFLRDLARCHRITAADAGVNPLTLPVDVAQVPLESQL